MYGDGNLGWTLYGAFFDTTVAASPSNSVAPSVDPTTFLASPGTWTGDASGYTYQWQRDVFGNNVFSSVSGATAGQFNATGTDAGCNIRVRVTASNEHGSTTVTSAAILVTTGDAIPVFYLKFSPTTNPLDEPVWVDISTYLMRFSVMRGRQFELNRMEAGTAQFSLDNTDRRFDPTNESGPYFGDIRPLNKIQLYATYYGVTYYIFTGFVENWPQLWESPDWSESDVTAVDGFEVLSQTDLVSPVASLTTSQGSNKDITYTSLVYGVGGNSITVTYVTGASYLSVDVTAADITVNLASGSTANDVVDIVNSDINANVLVVADLAPGSNGSGTVGSMTSTNLTGGGYATEFTGVRVRNVLDDVGWPDNLRIIDLGRSKINAGYITASKSGSGTAALSHLQDDVEPTELGYTFQDASGNMVFHDRAHRFTATRSTVVQGLFGDDFSASELEYIALVPEYEKTHIYNVVSVSPNSGDPQIARDQDSIDAYMQRWYSLSTKLQSEADALCLANFILSIYKDPHMRFSSITIEPLNGVDLWHQALTREIGDLIQVNRRPPSLGVSPTPGMLSIKCFVENISWTMNPGKGDGTVTFELSNQPNVALDTCVPTAPPAPPAPPALIPPPTPTLLDLSSLENRLALLENVVWPPLDFGIPVGTGTGVNGPWFNVGEAGAASFVYPWVNVGFPYNPTRYRLNAIGETEIELACWGGAPDSVIFVLPLGFTGAYTQEDAVSNGAGLTVNVRVTSDGSVYWSVT